MYHFPAGGWNDPPKDLFHAKSTSASNLSVEEVQSKQVNVMDTLRGILEILKQMNETTPLRRVVEDTEKRMQFCFERMSNNQMSLGAKTMMVEITNAINAKDFVSSQTLISKLTATHVDESRWVVGLKRLVELWAGVCAPS